MSSISKYMAEPPLGVSRFAGDTIQPNMAACSIATTLVALGTVAIRLYTRFFLTEAKFQIDDVFVCCAITCSILLIPFSFKIMQAGVGLHMWDVTFAQYNPGLGIWTLVITIFYAWAVIFSKLSILAFYLRLSARGWFRIATLTLMGVCACYVMAYTFLFIFRCRPMAQNWDISITTGTCLNTTTIMTVLSVANIVMDILTVLLPIPIIMGLNMRLAQRISVIILLSSGLLVCAIAIKRTLQMFQALASTDYTWDITTQFYWSYLEINIGILCTTVPALKPFAKRHLSGMFSSSGRSKGRTGTSGVHSGQENEAYTLRLTPKHNSYTRF